MDSVVHIIFMAIGILLILVVGIALLFIIILGIAYHNPTSSVDNMLALRKFVEEKYHAGELDNQDFRDAYNMIGYWVSNP